MNQKLEKRLTALEKQIATGQGDQVTFFLPRNGRDEDHEKDHGPVRFYAPKSQS